MSNFIWLNKDKQITFKTEILSKVEKALTSEGFSACDYVIEKNNDLCTIPTYQVAFQRSVTDFYIEIIERLKTADFVFGDSLKNYYILLLWKRQKRAEYIAEKNSIKKTAEKPKDRFKIVDFCDKYGCIADCKKCDNYRNGLKARGFCDSRTVVIKIEGEIKNENDETCADAQTAKFNAN